MSVMGEIAKLQVGRMGQKPRRSPQTSMPTLEQVWQIPLAQAGEFELTDKEAQTLRTRIYAINKNNAWDRRYRTMRDGRLLIVWRIN